MFDTGATIHVCPPWFASTVPLEPDENVTSLVGIDGARKLHIYGIIIVYVRFTATFALWMRFVVADVSFPVMSFSKLQDKGLQAHLDGEAYFSFGMERVELQREGSLYYAYPEFVGDMENDKGIDFTCAARYGDKQFNSNSTSISGQTDWW